MRRTIPERESLTVEFKSDRKLDYSSLPVKDASEADLDPLERERLRQMVERYGGDRSLLSLTDEELDGALGLVRREGGQRVPPTVGSPGEMRRSCAG